MSTMTVGKDIVITTDGTAYNALTKFNKILYSGGNKIEIYSNNTLVLTINGSSSDQLYEIFISLVGSYQRTIDYSITYTSPSACTLL